MSPERKLRVLLGKPGLDGHDRGIKIIARGFRDAGFEVIYTGCHQPCEIITGTELPVAWFAHGLRILDYSNPHSIKEIASYMPTPTGHIPRPQSNDVTIDDRGLLYLLDRVKGLNILERE